MKTRVSLVLAVLVASMSVPLPSRAQERSASAPAFSSAGELLRPADYRDWVFLTTGLGMTYGPAEAAAGRPLMFDNVFVTREAHREFLRSGTWPDGTMFILELREALTNVSINNGGHTQGAVRAIEAAVKDRQRFPDGGWAYFTFNSRSGLTDSAAPLPATASCYSCHRANTAVDNTFVQFYPTLFEVAKRLGTIKPTYDPARKP
jgi:hypothetical protein